MSLLPPGSALFDHRYYTMSSSSNKIMYMYMFLMRDEKEERKKQARSNKQTRQSNTAHPSTLVAATLTMLQEEVY